MEELTRQSHQSAFDSGRDAPESEGRSISPPRFQLTAGGEDQPPPSDRGEGSVAATPEITEGVAHDSLLQQIPSPSTEWDDFAIRFNSEFQSILHVFMEDTTMASADVGERSGTELTGAQLATMISEEQRRLLTNYFDTNVIPDYLFNGDEPSPTDSRVSLGLTAQQRILISAQILADGTYEPGSFSQGLHARMCFHWAQLVHHYAGATTGTGPIAARLMGNFDHDGNAVFGTGRVEEHLQGATHRFEDIPNFETEGAECGTSTTRHGEAGLRAAESGDAERLHRFARRDSLSFSQMERFRPGDWLYLYVGNASPLGSHSVIFSHWITGVLSGARGRYRRAVCFSQNNPANGGSEHTASIGEEFAPDPYNIYTVVNWTHINSDAHTARTLEEMVGGGTSPRPAGEMQSANDQYIQRIERERASQGRRISRDAVMDALQTEATGFLNTLAGTEEERTQDEFGAHLSPGQLSTLRTGIESRNLETLVQIHQRLRPMAANAELLDRNQESRVATVDQSYETASARYDLEIGECATQIAAFEAQFAPVVQAMIENMRQLSRIDGYERHAEMVEDLAETQTTLAGMTPRDENFLETRQHRNAIFQTFRRLRAGRRSRGTEAERLIQATRALHRRIPGYISQMQRQEDRVEETTRSLPYISAHPGHLDGQESNPRVNGHLEDVFDRRRMRTFLIAQAETTPSP